LPSFEDFDRHPEFVGEGGRVWSVDCFCGGVFGGGDQEAGGEPVGAYFVGAVVAGRVTIMRVA
jgi:hypothetical protein